MMATLVRPDILLRGTTERGMRKNEFRRKEKKEGEKVFFTPLIQGRRRPGLECLIAFVCLWIPLKHFYLHANNPIHMKIVYI